MKSPNACIDASGRYGPFDSFQEGFKGLIGHISDGRFGFGLGLPPVLMRPFDDLDRSHHIL